MRLSLNGMILISLLCGLLAAPGLGCDGGDDDGGGLAGVEGAAGGLEGLGELEVGLGGADRGHQGRRGGEGVPVDQLGGLGGVVVGVVRSC